jgi:hypothetical protein
MTKRKDKPGDPQGERDFVHGVGAGLMVRRFPASVR